MIEIFFTYNSRHKLITPPELIPRSRFHFLTAEQLDLKYGAQTFKIPENINTEFDKKIESIQNSQVVRDTKYPNNGKSFRVLAHLSPPYENVPLYDAEYKIDDNDHRIVENQNYKTKATKFVLALGDSFTFGEGVTTGLDYPSQLATKLNSDYKVYNFGKRGFGTNDLLYQLQTDSKLLDLISQNNGTAVWLFIDSHFERFLCTFKCYQFGYKEYIHVKPYYSFTDDKLLYMGTFAENQTPDRKLLSLLAKSETLKFYNSDYNYTDLQLKAFVESLREIKSLIERKKKLKNFYFVMLHFFSQKDQLTELLEKNGISVIDLSDIPNNKVKNMKIPFDGHPTSQYYWIISEVLKNKIQP